MHALPTKKIPTLQSLRAMAALLVVFDHAALASAHHGLPDQLPLLGLFLGGQGVAIFFVISGFIMTYTAERTDEALQGATSFALRRIVRVVPLYWLFTLVTALAATGIGLRAVMDITPGHLLKSLFFIPYVNSHANLLPVLPMGWTLNFEMVFYLLFAATILLPLRLRIPMLLFTLAGAVAAGAAFFPILSGINPRSVAEFLTNPIILLFGLGAALGWLRLRYPDLSVRLPSLLLAVPLLTLNSWLVFVAKQSPLQLRWNATFWLIDGVIVALSIFGKPMRLPRLEAIGNASYSLYLIHLLPLVSCFLLWKLAHFRMPVVFIVAALVTSAITALGAYRWLERPLTRTLARLLERPADIAVSEPAAPTLQQV